MKKLLFTFLIALLSFFSATANELFLNAGGETVVIPFAEIDSVVHGTYPQDGVSKGTLVIHDLGNDTCDVVSFYKGNFVIMMCDKDSLSSLDFSGGYRGDVVSNSACKDENSNSIGEKSDIAFTYQYDSKSKTLIINAIDQFFDCCSDVFGAESKVGKDTIEVSVYGNCLRNEFNFVPSFLGICACNCICPYDITYKINNVEPKKYHLKLVFDEYDIDLSQSQEGVVRTQPQKFGCNLLNVSDCKFVYDDDFSYGFPERAPYNDFSSFMVSYDSDTVVSYYFNPNTQSCRFVSYNREFSVYSNRFAQASMNGDSIEVKTFDQFLKVGPGKDIICAYDVTAEVTGLEAKSYHFTVDGHSFDVDFSRETEEFVVERDTVSKVKLLKTSACKSENADGKVDVDSLLSRGASDTLVSYRYNPVNGMVYVVSYNQQLLSCSPYTIEGGVEDGVVSISTKEDYSGCSSYCIYDVFTKVNGIKEQKYHFVVDGVSFDADFSQQKEGAVLWDAMPRGRFLAKSECKNNRDDDTKAEPSRRDAISDTMVTFAYDDVKKELTIVSYNQELNCCSDVSSNTSVYGDNITIKTTEKNPDCRCLCLFDVTTKLSAVGEQTYHFDVDGTSFDVDFSKQKEGVVMRDTVSKVFMTDQGECKIDTFADSISVLSDTLISYYYDPYKWQLHVISYNQAHNCCGRIIPEITVDGNSIKVKTTVGDLLCDCNCLIDDSFIITEIKEKAYHFEVNGVSFDLDLSKNLSGEILK